MKAASAGAGRAAAERVSSWGAAATAAADGVSGRAWAASAEAVGLTPSAASGDATGYGTAANALNDTQILGQQNLARIYTQGNQSLVGSDIAVANDLGQAAAANSRGTAALVGGLFNLGTSAFGGGSSNGPASGLSSIGSGSYGTALGSASQYAPFKAGMGL